MCECEFTYPCEIALHDLIRFGEKAVSVSNDIFAEIARTHGHDRRRGLVCPGPKPVAPSLCVLQRGDAWAFGHQDKIDTPDKLRRQLEAERQRYAVFLQDCAPKVQPMEERVYIRDFTFSLDGGEKKAVTVPHYGGPTGDHTAVYEAVFTLPAFSGRRLALRFLAVDYIAEVFINDAFAGRHEGFFSPFEFDITDLARAGENTLRVVVRNKEKMQFGGDKIYAATGLGWDDPQCGWHHCPGGMGIYNHVFVELRSPLYISDLFPRMQNGRGELWIECQCGPEVQKKNVHFLVSVYGQNFEHTEFEDVCYTPGTRYEVGLNDTFTEAMMKDGKSEIPLPLGPGFNRFILPLVIENPRCWDTVTPWLYKVVVRLVADGKVVSVKSRQFGVRSFVQDLNSEPKGKFYLNGKEIRLYGANTMGFEQQDVFKGDFDQLIDDILLAKICHMNFWRVTQRPVQEEVYDYCDRLGLMVQTDLPIFGCVRINQYCECIRQGEEMERLVRSHPCCILDSYINEPFPNGNNMPHRMLSRKELQTLFHSLDRVVHLHNPDRVIKHADGDYDAPGELLPDNHCYCMWYNGHGMDAGKLYKGYWMDVKPGWHYGCGEFGSEGLDNRHVIQERYPKEWLNEPFNPVNVIGSQLWPFHHMLYETPQGLDGWITRSQAYQAFATKIMTGAFRRNEDMNTFAIHLFIDAFPSGWMKAIMDCERQPKPAFYAYMDCLEPVYCSLRSDRFTFFAGERVKLESYLCNDTQETVDELRYMVEQDGQILWSAAAQVLGTVSQGHIVFEAPAVLRRTPLRVSMGAFSNGRLLHEARETYWVYPAVEKRMPDVVSWKEFQKHQEQMERSIQEGGCLIVQGPQPGRYHIAGKEIKVRPCFMEPLYTVSRDTGHPCVEGLEANELSWLYDSGQDRVAPLACRTFDGEGIVPIVVGGNRDEERKWSWHPVCGEWTYGEGRIILTVLELENREENPAAVILLNSLHDYQRQHTRCTQQSCIVSTGA